MGEINWDNIRNEFETTSATLSDLAEKYDIKFGTIRSRKCREKWEKPDHLITTTKEKSATQRPTKKKATTKKKTAQPKKKRKPLPKKKPKTAREKFLEDVVIENKDLTEKQRLFCLYYVKYWNATKAYQKAYDCTYQVANVRGPTLLVNISIKQEIDRLKKLLASGIYLEAMAVFQKYIDIAFSDMTDYVSFGQKEVQVIGPAGPLFIEDEDGEEKPLNQLVNYIDLKDSNTVDGTLITEVSQGRDGIKIKLADRTKALNKLSLYFDLFPDKFKRQIEEARLKLEEAKAKTDEGQEKEIHVHTGIPGVNDE